MSRQDIVDTLLLRVAAQPTPEAAQSALDAGLKEIADRYDGHSRDELAQVMAVYERSESVFKEAVQSAGTAQTNNTSDAPDPVAVGAALIAADAGDDTQVADLQDRDLDNDGHDDETGQFSTKAEREAELEQTFGEVAEDEKPRPIEEVFGEVGDATASAEVVDAPLPTGHDDSNAEAPVTNTAPLKEKFGKKAKGKKSSEDLV